MAQSDQTSEAYRHASEALDAHWDAMDSPEFLQALEQMTMLADQGDIDAAECIAEIHGQRGPHYDAERAYLWYYIALSQQGYAVGFADENHSPPNYCGPPGDFRNEAQVTDLVQELGFERARELDAAAAAWLAKRGLKQR